ncbi:zinc finger CDGSH type, partial [Oesophagostomum dentatum]
VVDTVDVEDIGEKKAFCRCWKSEKFPYCDGAHTKHNKETGDNVVDTVDVEDIGEKKAFCRCWKSEKFPYCDGAHTKHNKETGDNVGPLLVKGKQQ